MVGFAVSLASYQPLGDLRTAGMMIWTASGVALPPNIAPDRCLEGETDHPGTPGGRKGIRVSSWWCFPWLPFGS